ncbi:von Willebrand factor A domain-containing protein 9 [Trichinella pseudospiralis]|uniref:von Willebrand factor A domain-containing protein 9 n=1 Tax=Trichinella pseudospiralis TaxID=6337 RepID=A0A0V0YK74_TRIPS|nr:von Willebrand factor A domain-containing protein 9 [Trichinella pseudospiralis]
MPSIILIDVSLKTMVISKTVNLSYRQILLREARNFLKAIHDIDNTEEIALVTFGKGVTILSDFSTDYETMISKLPKDEDIVDESGDFFNAVYQAISMFISCWTSDTYGKIFLLTATLWRGGEGYVAKQCYPKFITSLFNKVNIKLCIFCYSDFNHYKLEPFYNEFVSAFQINGVVHHISLAKSEIAVGILKKIVEIEFRPFCATMACGTIKCNVLLIPPPQPLVVTSEFKLQNTYKFDSHLTIIGFAGDGDFAMVPTINSYLLLAASTNGCSELIPHFCVLLRAALANKKNFAICRVSEEWYGLICCVGNDRTQLCLKCFPPGKNPFPWIGSFDELIPSGMSEEIENIKRSVKISKPSYASRSYTCWIDTNLMKNDVLKLLKLERKLPEKQVAFYQDLNRFCQHALAIGCAQFFQFLASTFEKHANSVEMSDIQREHFNHYMAYLKLTKSFERSPLIPPFGSIQQANEGEG